MAMSVQRLLELSVPEHLKEEVAGLIDSPKVAESLQEDRRDRRHPSKDELMFVAIAMVMTDVWSPQMRRHVENLILQKAVQEKYLEDHHLKWVHVLDEEENVGEDWVIKDQDDAMATLVWDVFNMKKHFKETHTHRDWIQRSFDRLGKFMPELHPEIVDRHDLSKFAFSQAVGYTLKWVHNIYHGIWDMACKLHLNNEPHHPQMWSSTHTAREKRLKLELWTKDVCDFHQGHPYNLAITTLNLKSEEIAFPFLLESYIDMVAVEWERKKNADLSISDSALAFMEERFLHRYTVSQRKIVSALMCKIMDSSSDRDEAP